MEVPDGPRGRPRQAKINASKGESSDASRRQDLHRHRRGLGTGHRTRHRPALRAARRPGVILDLDGDRPRRPPRELGDAHRGYRLQRHRQGGLRGGRAKVIDEFGRVDVLVNNAGITQPVKTMEIDAEGLRRHPRRQPARHALPEPGLHPRHADAASRARSSACRRSRRSAAAASSAARTTPPPRPACSASPRRWRASSGPTASASTP